ncbi:MAG: antitoxin VapB family protein [Halobaculum sp.]
MSDTTIRLSTDAKRRLDLHKRDEESYEDVIVRLTERDRWAGFGAFEETDADEAAEGLSEIRSDMDREMSERIERIGDG